MEDKKPESSVKSAVSLTQLAISVVIIIVSVTSFIIMVQSDVSAAHLKLTKAQEEINEMKYDAKTYKEKTEQKLDKIIDMVNEIKLSLQNKIDRKP